MTISPRKTILLAITAVAFSGGLFWSGSGNIDGGFVSKAEARIGRPLTPMSYAGVARRTTRRAAVVGGAVAAGCLAYEFAYGKGLTPFLRFARSAGAGRLADGVGMRERKPGVTQHDAVRRPAIRGELHARSGGRRGGGGTARRRMSFLITGIRRKFEHDVYLAARQRFVRVKGVARGADPRTRPRRSA